MLSPTSFCLFHGKTHITLKRKKENPMAYQASFQ